MSSAVLFGFLTVIFLCTKSEGYETVMAWQDDLQEIQSPPPVDQLARMARYVVHISDWCTISSLGSKGNTTGYPKARVFSFVDGDQLWSTGIPYVYTTLKDPQIQDLTVNNRSSVTVSMAQGSYCKQQNYDPEDPRCTQIILTGQFTFVQNGTREFELARSALFARHPVMINWPKSHHWKVGKLVIEQVQVVDNFGGSKYPSVQEYFQATPY